MNGALFRAASRPEKAAHANRGVCSGRAFFYIIWNGIRIGLTQFFIDAMIN
jgi:hypothetical protein